MKSKVVLSLLLVGLIVVSTFMVIAIAQTAEGSQNKIYYYPDSQISKNETTTQANESETFTIISATELPGEKSWEPPSSKEEKVMAIEIAKEQVNIEPILKKIIESSFHPPSEIVRIEATGKVYKVPPGVGNIVLAKIYVPNKPSENLYTKIEALEAYSSRYYQSEGFIKVKVPIANVTEIASLSEITDVRRVINFPLTTQEYNIRVENGKQYYHVFLDVEDHAPTDAMFETLDTFGIKIKKRYNDGITDFRVYLPVDNLTEIAELPFVTHIEYCDLPVQTELYMAKKMTDVDYVKDNIDAGLDGSGVNLTVIDTGIDHHHPYLPTPYYELDVKDNWPDDDDAEDDSGHGTHVIGIITNNYDAPSGYEGVAPDVDLAVIKTNSRPWGGLTDVKQQIYDAIDHAVNDAHAQVISMSLGLRNADWIINQDGTTKWEQKVDWATREGAIFVKSAGNQGDVSGYNSITSPGAAKNVIAVGAINHWYHEEDNVTIKNTARNENIDEVTYYSSRGDTGDDGHEAGRDKPEVVAPGGTLCWDCPDGMADGVVSARGKNDDQSSYLPLVDDGCSYKNENLYRMFGTSMAAPHVSGITALVIENYGFAKSNRNAALVKAMIVGSGINIGDNDLVAGHADNHIDDDIGYGKVDLYQAIGYTGPNRKCWYIGGSLDSSGDVITHTFTVPSDKTYHHIKTTVTWNDPPTTSTDPNWGALKNDIDINLTGPGGNPRDSSMSWQQNIEQMNYYDSNGITLGDWKINVKAGVHWDSAQEYGGLVCLYTEEPHTVVDATAIRIGNNVQITATVNNTGGETASGVIISLNVTEPSGHSIDDYFTIDSGYKETLLGNIPPSGSRSVSWTLTPKNTIPENITFSVNATYSNPGLMINDTVTLIPIELNITSPTQSTPAFAGSYNDTNHITVKVEAKTTDGTPSPGCSKDNFSVEIGGISAGFTLAEGMPGQYILDVSSPTQPSEGLYNLTVTLFGTISDNESNAVRYGGFGRNIDAVLIIDRSGSMDYSHDYPPYSNRMEAAKASAKDFLDLMILGDRASLVSFASSARLDVGFSGLINYTMEDVSYQWESDYGTGLNQGDDDTDLVNIGFTFNFYGTDYTGINVKSNGWMSFTSTSTAYSNPLFPTTSYSNVIAPLWDDLNPSANGDVYYNTLGTAPNRRFVVTWYEIPHYSNVGSNTFQAVLYESSGEIQFNYNSLTVTSSDGQTIGLNEGDGERFTSYTPTPPPNSTSIRFYPYETSTNLDQVRNAIDQLYGSGSTAIGEGIYIGVDELDDHGDTNHGWGMILLTDGAWNTGRDPRQAAQYASSKGIPIYTIGIGDRVSSEFDENLLIDIAGTTSGEYQYAKEVLDLQTIYSTLSGTIRGETQITSATGSVNQSETVVHDVLVDNSISELTITVNWAGSDVDTYLYYPNGTFANSTIDPDIDYSGNTTKPEWYRIRNPQVGEWAVEIYGRNVPLVGECYSLTASAQTSLTFRANTDKTQVDVGEPVKIIASIMRDSDPITGASVIANVTRPDGVVEVLILQDKNNGIYEAYYYNTARDGGYSVKVTAIKSGEFTREAVTQFRVEEIILSVTVSPGNWTLSLLPGNQGSRTFNVSVNSTVQTTMTNEFQSLLEERIGKERTMSILSQSVASHDVVAVIQGTILTDSFGNTISANAWSFNPNTLTISPGGSETFGAYLNIPADAVESIYDGSIIIATSAGNAKVDVSANTIKPPDIWASPTSFYVTLLRNTASNKTLIIGNNGTGVLNFEITDTCDTSQSGKEFFKETFLSTTINTSNWISTTGSPVINTLGINEPSSPYSLDLDGSGDTITSKVIDLSGQSAVALSFYYELGGGGEAPDSGDWLSVDYYSSSMSWKNIWSKNGDGSNHNIFNFTSIPLPSDALHSNFKFKFRSNGSGASYDDFYIDDVKVGIGESKGNYTLSNVTYQWLDGVTGGTPLYLGDDDSKAKTLPFTFNFYRMDFNTIYIGSNGYVDFVDSTPTSTGGVIPSTGSDYQKLITPLWDDWNPAATGSDDIYVKAFTSPNRYVITWNNLLHYGQSSNSSTFQIVLYDSGNIQFNYKAVGYTSGVTVGLNEGDGIHYNDYTLIPTNRSSILFTKQIEKEWLSVTPTNGTVNPNNQTDITVTINATGLNVSEYSANITITSNDPDEGSINVPVYLSVGEPTADFDTGAPSNPYPSISGLHNGTIKPNQTITVTKLYTYSCPGTGGHTESIEIYENNTLIANGTWNGYQSDWHNITIQNLTGGAPYVTLLENHEYNYTIRTGSYPQIIHEQNCTTLDGSFINCTSFVDANGKKYYDWIPAIRLFLQ